jgi:TolB protein
MRFPDFSSTADIFVADADGSSEVNITNHPAEDGCPRWSPVDDRILLSSDRAGETGQDAYVMHADGSDVTRLTFAKGTELCPDWSSDGRRIAFGQFGNRNPGLYVMNADGRGAHRIYSNGFAFQPSWSSDGGWLTFHRWHGGALDVYVIRSDGSDLAPVTRLKELAQNPNWTPF